MTKLIQIAVHEGDEAAGVFGCLYGLDSAGDVWQYFNDEWTKLKSPSPFYVPPEEYYRHPVQQCEVVSIPVTDEWAAIIERNSRPT